MPSKIGRLEDVAALVARLTPGLQHSSGAVLVFSASTSNQLNRLSMTKRRFKNLIS
jgi:hypothetical protein